MIRQLQARVEKVETILDQHKLARDQAIFPILKVFGIERVHIEEVIFETKGLTVIYGWSCRGCYDNDRCLIPYEIIDAEDPILAALEYHRGEKIRKEAGEREDDRIELLRLAEKLSGRISESS